MGFLNEVESRPVKNLFKSKIDNLSIYGYVERHTFKLVEDYLDGKYDENDYDIDIKLADEAVDKLTAMENKGEQADITKALIKDIEVKLSNLKSKISIDLYQALSYKLRDLKAAYYDLDAIRNIESSEIDNIGDKHQRIKAEKEYESMLFEANQLVDYSIIELNAALGLKVEYFSNSKIRNYCDAIVWDVNNDKYKRLSFKDHISSDGSINLCK